jgi:hypothetical protein
MTTATAHPFLRFRRRSRRQVLQFSFPASEPASMTRLLVYFARAAFGKPSAESAGQSGTKRKMSPNVPRWRSTDRRDKTGQKPKGFVPDVPLRDRPSLHFGLAENSVGLGANRRPVLREQ